MNQAQHTKSLLGYGAGLLSLCLGATALFFTLRPNADSLQGFEPETIRPQSVAKAPGTLADIVSDSKTASLHESMPVTRTQESETSQPEAPRGHDMDEGVQPIVEVLAPGKIRLTEEQTELLKGRGASWGQANAEAEAVLRAIPKEAFTSDW